MELWVICLDFVMGSMHSIMLSGIISILIVGLNINTHTAKRFRLSQVYTDSIPPHSFVEMSYSHMEMIGSPLYANEVHSSCCRLMHPDNRWIDGWMGKRDKLVNVNCFTKCTT